MSHWQSVIGHEALVAALRRAIAHGAVNHAYIFAGEAGMGKKTVANAFAKALQCESGDRDGTCLSCRVFDSGNHPDVVYVKPDKNKSIGVDDVRAQIIAPMAVKPFRYRYKIFIIGEADILTPAAQNALLKTMEEPAHYGIFLLAAQQPHNLLPTVLSRCTLLKLKPLSDGQVREALTARGVSAGAADACVPFAQGNIGKALTLAASEDFIAMRALAEEICRDIRDTDIAAALAWYKRVEKWKESSQMLLDMLYLCYIERMTGEKGEKIVLLRGADAIGKTKQILRQNGNFQLAIELLLLRLGGHYDHSGCAV